MRNVRSLIVILATTVAAGLLFVNVYNSVVDAPNWGHDIPASLEVTRSYFAVANPGTFFRVISPANQLLTLIAVVLTWPLGWPVRVVGLTALASTVLLDVFTFAYFYPRNAIMFEQPLQDLGALRDAWVGWSQTNWLRSGLAIGNVVLDNILLARTRR